MGASAVRDERLGDGLADVRGQVGERDLDRGAGLALGELGGAGGQAALADGDPERDADQFGVAELHARPDRPVVHDDVDSGVGQGHVDLLPRFGHRGVVLLGDHDHDLERGHRDRPDDALGVVVDLDHGGHGAFDADAVAAHDRADRLAVRAGHADLHGLGVLGAELEDVADLDAALHLQAVPAVDAAVAGGDLAQVRPLADADVALDVHAAQVGVVDVGAGVHAAPAAPRLIAQGLVRDDGVIGDADRAQAAGQRAQGVADLVRQGRADRVRAGGVDELLLVQRVVAAQQDQGEHAVQVVDQGLDLAFGRGLVALREVLDGLYPGSVERFRGLVSHGPFGKIIIYGGQPRRRLLDVRRVTALWAQDDQVLARRRRADELGGVRAAHRAAGGLDRNGGDSQPLEDPHVRVVVQAEGHVELIRAHVEAVGVLHGELAGAHQPGLRPRLVAQLGLDLVPHLRQLAVGLELGGQVGDDLLVGHAEGQVGAAPVLEPEHLVTHQLPAPAELPQLGRVHDRHHDLLGPDPVHLLADDRHDLEPDPLAERQHRVVPGHQRADEAGPEQQAVAGCARVCRVVAQRRDVHRGPAHTAYSHFHAKERATP